MALSRDQFKAVAKERGYTLSEVAELWELTPARLSQIARDLARSALYEYALWGLPAKRIAALVTARRGQAAHQLSAKAASAPKTRDVWDDLTKIGSIFAVQSEQGEHLPEGCEGVVVARERRRGELHVSIRFAGGYREAFALSYLQGPSSFLTATGRSENPDTER